MRASHSIRVCVALATLLLAIVVAGSPVAQMVNRPLVRSALLPSPSHLTNRISTGIAATITRIDNPAPANEGRFGGAVEGIGDVTGDGMPDFAIGAHGADKVYLISGASRTLIREINDPDNLTGMLFGWSLSAAGDVNGDGPNDLAVGAPGDGISRPPVCVDPPPPYNPGPELGRAFILSTATGELLRRIPLPCPIQNFGKSLATLDDLTGDGIREVVVGVVMNEAPFHGAIYTSSVGNGDTLWASYASPFGMATVADLNGDGRRDLLVGGVLSSTSIDFSGQVFVISGADGATIRTHDGFSAFSYFGSGLADIGDQDGDGLHEYAIGAPGEGKVYLFRGSDGMLFRTLSVNPTPDTESRFGRAIANVGDKDGDGRDDFWVSASRAGTLYLFNEGGTQLTQVSDPTPPATPLEEGGFGWQLATTADVGGDCGLDLLVGEFAEPFDNSGTVLTNAGAAYVVTLAQVGTPPVINALAPMTGTPGTSVRIAGAGFTGASAVTFGGVNATFSVDSDSQITATVPATVVTGQIKITVRGCTAASAHNFHSTTNGGLLDSIFNGSGKRTTDFNGSTDLGNAVAIQPDGKIVIAGVAFSGITGNDFAVARYLPSGALDSSFGSGGKVMTDFAGGTDVAYAVAIQADGKIVVAGGTETTAEDFALVRYNTNGSLDDATANDSTPGDSFGAGGKVITNFGFASSVDRAYAIAIQADGRIVAAGTALQQDYALARYNTNGTPDNTFDGDGKLTTSFAFTGNEFARAVGLQVDGKIIAAGYSVSLGDFTIARYNTNGSLDNGFGTFGKVITDFGASDQAFALNVRPNGHIIVAGSSGSGTNVNFALARYNSDGSLDNTFDADGRRTDDFFGFHDRIYGIAVQTDGKIVTAGYASTALTSGANADESDFALARYNGDGTLDSSFDGDGKVTTLFSPTRDEANAVTIQKDGKIIAAGLANLGDPPGGPGFEFALARYGGETVPPGEVQFSDAKNSVTENVGSVTITVTRSDSGAGMVNFAASNGTATAGSDYNATSGTLTFAPGETSKTFAVPITNDIAFEGLETVNLTLSEPTGSASLGVISTAVLTIFDNDVANVGTPAGPAVNVQAGGVSVTFDSVTGAGSTTITPIDPSSSGPLPGGFSLCSGCPAYDITTTAAYTPPLTVCFNVPSVTDPVAFSHLKMLHGEGGLLIDRTSSQNFSSKTVCGSVNSLSPFIVAQSSAPTAAPAAIRGQVTTGDGAPLPGVTITLSGLQSAVTITDGQGRYSFEDVETGNFYSITPALVNYHFSPANRSFSLLGERTEAVFTATPDALPTGNPLDTTEFFVRQHYLDFLDRDPDQHGFEYWSSQINRCGGDVVCVQERRIDVSAAFFIEQEFQRTGSFIHYLYRGALVRRPSFAEYQADRRQVVVDANLEEKKAAFAERFVQRAEFLAKYQTTSTAASFVDALLANVWQSSNVDLTSERENLISAYHTGSNLVQSRALVVSALADDATFKQAEYNAAFVTMEYFGYLRRNPDESGLKFWLEVLNNRDRDNFRGMVCAFLTSAEYQRRFSSVVTHSDSECSR